MSWKKTWLFKLLIYLSDHYWRVLVVCMLLTLSLSFYRILRILPRPTVVKGTTVDVIVTYSQITYSRMGGRHVDNVTAPIIRFEYEGKPYRIIGGTGAEKGAGIETEVIFNRSEPENALEFTFWGLMNYRIFIDMILICAFLPATLLAIALINKRFADTYGLFIHFRNLTWRKALTIAVLLLLLPLIPHTKQLIFGKVTKGIVIDDNMWSDGHLHRVVVFTAGGKEYKIPATGDYDGGEKIIGRSAPLLYVPSDPDDCAIYTFDDIYINYWLVWTFAGFMILIGWAYASTVGPDDEEAPTS